MLIYAVYQDCIFCKEKGKKILKELNEAGVEVEKVSFATSKGIVLTPRARKNGIIWYPFYTDGDKFFSDDYLEVIEYKNKIEAIKKEQDKENETKNTRLRAGAKTKKGGAKKKRSAKSNSSTKKSD